MAFRLLLFFLGTIIYITQALTIPQHEASLPLDLTVPEHSTNVPLDQAFPILEGRSKGQPLIARANTYRDPSAPMWNTWYCSNCGQQMNSTNTDKAVRNVRHKLALLYATPNYIPPHHNVHSIVGDVVAFMCVGAIEVRVDPEAFNAATEAIAQKCGSFIAGTQANHFIAVHETKYASGYMRYHPGLDFCKGAESSLLSSCPKPEAAERSLASRSNGAVNVYRDSSAVNSRWYCGCGLSMDQHNTNVAVYNVNVELSWHYFTTNDYIPKWGVVSSVVGDVVAFVCNGPVPVRINPETFRHALEQVTNKCGRFIAGTQTDRGSNHVIYSMGYMRYRPGLDFCYDAEGSSQHSCPLKREAEELPLNQTLSIDPDHEGEGLPEDQGPNVLGGHAEAATPALVVRDNETVSTNQTSEDVMWESWYCGCGIGMDRPSTDNAVDNVKKQLDRHVIAPGMVISSIVGGTVAFLCNGPGVVEVHGDEFGLALAQITRRCGQYVPGTRREEIKHYDIGYMRYTPGLDFCAHAASSPMQWCP